MFKPRYIKHGHLLVRHAEKLLRYRKDVLSEVTIADLKTQIEKLREGLRDKDKKTVKEESERLHNLYTKHMPAGRDAGWFGRWTRQSSGDPIRIALNSGESSYRAAPVPCSEPGPVRLPDCRTRRTATRYNPAT